MATLIQWLSLGGVVVLCLGWLLYTPIPAGYKKPWQVHVAYTQANILWKTSALAERLGLGTFHEVNRGLWNTAAKKKNQQIKDGVKVKEENFDGVRVLTYTPPGEEGKTNLPGLVYIHGGAWITGSPETHELLTRQLAAAVKMVVVSVDYRLAPEHTFPADVDDCVTATTHFLRNADRYGVDPHRIAVGGDSSGGHLTAAVSLRLRTANDTKLASIKLQLLLYPALQWLNLRTPSMQQNEHDHVLPLWLATRCTLLSALGDLSHVKVATANNHVSPATKKQLSATYLNVDNLPARFISKDYVPWNTDNGNETVWKDLKPILMNSYFSPLLADDLTNLPKAYIFTGENDILRDGGFWYAKRLRDAGVDVTHRAHPIAFHGIFNFAMIVDEAKECVMELVEYIRENI